MSCNDCNYLYKCPNCDISLTIHNYPKVMNCHHCSYTKKIDTKCQDCSSTNLNLI